MNEALKAHKIISLKATKVQTMKTSHTRKVRLQKDRLFYFVNLIKRSSYAATLIVMMVVVLGYVTFKFCFIFWFYVFNLDLEYHLSQLEWICAAFVVLHHLDDAKL